MIGWGNGEKVKWPLGEVPLTLGSHELQVNMPTGLAPACSHYAEYTFETLLHRTKGTGSNAASIVDVVSRPEDLYWPEGSRNGQEGPDDARVTIELDAETVSVGETLSGRAVIFATRNSSGDDVKLAFGPTVDTLVQVAGKPQPQPRAKFKPTMELELADKPTVGAGQQLEIPFIVDVPPACRRRSTTARRPRSCGRCGSRSARPPAGAWSVCSIPKPQRAAATRRPKACSASSRRWMPRAEDLHRHRAAQSRPR
jgi:hypothetical protein